ncbi:MAG: hypothetical protein H6857_04870 [Rhodospirillales bacterium]|nr:hypothetical protein [Rhodospirillales bacterium]
MSEPYHMFSGNIQREGGQLSAVFYEHTQHPWISRIHNTMPPARPYSQAQCQKLVAAGNAEHATRLAQFNGGQAHEALLAMAKLEA